MGNKQYSPKVNLVPIGQNFWNIRASFKFMGGLVDIGTHMSIIKLSTGKYLIFDTVPMNDDLKLELDALVGEIGGGNRIEGVVATHPFHTLAFPAFHKAFPNVPYYGTPRHIKKLPDIPWAGDVNDIAIRKKWEPDVYMRIPDGAEFVNPVPEVSNHFSSLWIFHPESKTLHIDDTIMFWGNPEVLLRLAGKKKGLMELHISLSGPGLLQQADAPEKFKKWTEAVIKDWDFDNICCAHAGNKIGWAKDALKEALANAQPTFDKLKERHLKAGNTGAGKSSNSKDWFDEDDPEASKECEAYNVDGTECG